MKEEPPAQFLDILCIGEIKSGKSYFLQNYTLDPTPNDIHIPYSIYAKNINHSLIYFHQLSEEEPLYLEKQYDGVLFFVDFIDTWYAVQNILKWMQLLSKITGNNVFSIPIKVIITKTDMHTNFIQWKQTLQNQLSSIISPNQIIYFEDAKKVQQPLANFLSQIINGEAKGIKSNTQNYVKLYGLRQILKNHFTNAKRTFFRWSEIFAKIIKNKLTIHGSIKNL